MRKIPVTMATQHPDNASVPYWGDSPAISTLDEVQECFHVFADLDCDEYMWDWEGKFVDEAVVDRLFNRYADYFTKKQLGRDKFLTFRIPNIWKEPGTRLARSFMTIMTAAQSALTYHVHTPPLFEVILPMTTSAHQLLTILKKFRQATRYEKDIFEKEIMSKHRLEMIPLVEGSASLLESRLILKDYAKGYTKLYGKKLSYLRPFIARSDPALDAGFIAATLSARGAISEYYRFAQETKIPVYPILGVGTLIFRGGLSPYRLDHFLSLYGGIRTVTLQSAFRYDFPLEVVKKTIATLKRRLPKTQPTLFSDCDLVEITKLAQLFAKHYRPVIQALAGTINDVAKSVPSHRERIPHTGHFGYSRKIGKNGVSLPRAIGFSATFYSLGIPPVLIGSGRGLREVIRLKKEKELKRYYPGYEEDLIESGRYLNWENLRFLARKDPTWEAIRQDVLFLEEYLGHRLGPKTPEDYIHRNLTSNVYQYWKQGKKEEMQANILQSGIVRKSLG